MNFIQEEQWETTLKNHGEDKATEYLKKVTASGVVADSQLGSKLLKQATAELATAMAAAKKHFTKPGAKKNLPQQVTEYLTTPDWSHTTKGGKEVYEPYANKAAKFAWIALSACMNAQFGKDGDNSFVAVAIAIAKALEVEARLSAYKQAAPGLFKHAYEKSLKDQLFGAGAALKAVDQTFAHCGVEVGVNWVTDGTNIVYTRVGGWMLSQVLNCTDLFEMMQGGYKKPNLVVMTDKMHDDMLATSELIAKSSFTAWPMLVEPADWGVNPNEGGYLGNGSVVHMPMVRNTKGNNPVVGATPIAFINNLQKVGYKVNAWVLDVVHQLQQDQTTQGLGSCMLYPTESSLNKADAKRHMRKCHQTANAIAAAEEMVTAQVFYTPWSFDWRGRVYPQTTVLISQTTDFGKSLITFAEGGEVNATAEKWLAIHLANTYGNGIDKAPLANRVAWVQENAAIIKDVVANTMAWVKAWADGELDMPSEPWQFLAACEEYVAVVLDKTRDTTCLMVGADATCSGLQILAGLTKDSLTAEYVNVIGGELPADAYTACMEAAKQHLAPELHNLLNRKVAKPVVMTTPYNSTAHSSGDKVREALDEQGIACEFSDSVAITLALRAGLQELMPKATQAMEWISQEVFKYTKANNLTTISWISPSGFEVMQTNCMTDSTRLEVTVGGKVVKVQVQTYDHTEANPKKHKSGTAPNLIHSLDGSLLHIAFAGFDKPFSLIHDCVLTRATDMDDAVLALKTTYANIFAGDVFKDIATQIGLDTTNMPKPGDLNPAAVLDSDYFFN